MQIARIQEQPCSPRIQTLKENMLSEKRYATIEQARIITESYRSTTGEPRCIQRAKALNSAFCRICQPQPSLQDGHFRT